MTLDNYFAPNLLIRVTPGFLTFVVRKDRSTELCEVSLGSREIYRFVTRLSRDLEQLFALPGFKTPISEEAFLLRDKIVFEAKYEQHLTSKELTSLIHVLIASIPLILMTGPESLPYVSALQAFSVILVEKVEVEEGKVCLKNIKRGDQDLVLLDFVGKFSSSCIQCDITELICFLYVHSKLIESCYLLRHCVSKRTAANGATTEVSETSSFVVLFFFSKCSYQSHASVSVFSEHFYSRLLLSLQHNCRPPLQRILLCFAGLFGESL
jgi:hypothetical protein